MDRDEMNEGRSCETSVSAGSGPQSPVPGECGGTQLVGGSSPIDGRHAWLTLSSNELPGRGGYAGVTTGRAQSACIARLAFGRIAAVPPLACRRMVDPRCLAGPHDPAQTPTLVSASRWSN